VRPVASSEVSASVAPVEVRIVAAFDFGAHVRIRTLDPTIHTLDRSAPKLRCEFLGLFLFLIGRTEGVSM